MYLESEHQYHHSFTICYIQPNDMELFITIVGSEYLFNKQTALYPVTMGGLQSSWTYISNYEMLYETTLSSEEKEKA